MANRLVQDRYIKIGTGTGGIAVPTTIVLGDANDGIVGTISIHFVNVSSFLGSFTIKARSRLPQADTISAPFLPIPYLKQYLNGAIADHTMDNAAITGSSIILVPASGLAIALDLTSYTSGTGAILWSPLDGAAA